MSELSDWFERYTSTTTHYQERDKYLRDNGYSSIEEVEQYNDVQISKNTSHKKQEIDLLNLDKCDKCEKIIIVGEKDCEAHNALTLRFPNKKIVYKSKEQYLKEKSLAKGE